MRVIERGTKFGVRPDRTNWVRVGPLMFEMHRWWFRIGVCAGLTGYVGVYLGFFVITIGRRRFADNRSWPAPTLTWEITSSSGAVVFNEGETTS